MGGGRRTCIASAGVMVHCYIRSKRERRTRKAKNLWPYTQIRQKLKDGEGWREADSGG
jgi:hypothetical protein